MDMINVKINGRAYQVPANSTVLEAAKIAGIEIPTLCYLKDINEIGACRLCLVEVQEMRGPTLGPARMVTACVYPVTEGMSIVTTSEKITRSRKLNLELILSNHNKECLSCVRSTTCELQKLCRDYGVDENHFVGKKTESVIDDSSVALIRDNSKCVKNNEIKNKYLNKIN